MTIEDRLFEFEKECFRNGLLPFYQGINWEYVYDNGLIIEVDNDERLFGKRDAMAQIIKQFFGELHLVFHTLKRKEVSMLPMNVLRIEFLY